MDQPRVVIVGGGFAGLLAAQKLRGAKARCVLVSESDSFVERVRFHEVAAGRPVARHSIPGMLARTGVEFRQARVEALDLARREVLTASGRIAYDHLFYALGSSVDLDRVAGARQHATSVASEEEARRLQVRLRALTDGARVAVCGGGLTAIELASEIAEAFPRLDVSLITQGQIGPGLSLRGRAFVRRSLRDLGVGITEEVTISRVRTSRLVTSTRREIPCELCVMAASFRVSPIAATAGLATRGGQVLVDETLRSLSHPEVFAAGDAAIPALEPGAPIRMGCATAMPMAAIAAANLRALLDGGRMVDFGFRYLAQFVSLGRKNALAQITRGDDTPRDFILTGRLAAWLKDLTFRYNLRGLRGGWYPYPSRMLAPRRPELAAADGPRQLPR